MSLSTKDKTQTASTDTIWQQNDPEFNKGVTFQVFLLHGSWITHILDRNSAMIAIVYQVEKADLKDGSLSLDVLDWDFMCYRKIGHIQVSETKYRYNSFVVFFCNI